MEDENRLELSLAPPCGGDTSMAKGKIGISDSRSDIIDRDTKLINEFKQFLDGGTMQIGSGIVSQRKPENFFSNLSSNSVDVDTSKNVNSGGFWIANERSAEGREENKPDAREKRKGLFTESSQPKKHEKETDHADLPEKSRASHISINTDDGSTAENEDVDDSEAEAPTSRHLLQQEDVTKRYMGSSLSEVNKDYHGLSHSNALEFSGQKRFTISSEKEFKHGNVPHNVQFNSQSMNIINMSQPLSVKDSNANGMHGRSGYPLASVMQVMGATSTERTGSQPVIPANLPLVAGYSSVPLPSLDKDNSRLIVSHHQQSHPSYIGRGPTNSDKHSDDLKITQGNPPKSLESKQHEGKSADRAIGNGKLLAEGATSHMDDDKKGNSAAMRPKDTTELPRAEGFPSEYPTIKPGIAAELKFGGSGSYPNLPWVSTTGSGPNGRTISGVTYRYSPAQIKIVCACHGTHMSPEEFVRHATSEEQTNQETGAGVASVPPSNPAASAQG